MVSRADRPDILNMKEVVRKSDHVLGFSLAIDAMCSLAFARKRDTVTEVRA